MIPTVHCVEIVTYNLPNIIDSRKCGRTNRCPRVIDRYEIPTIINEPVGNGAIVDQINSDNLPIVVDAIGAGCKGIGVAQRAEVSPSIQETVDMRWGQVMSYDLPAVVYALG